MTVLELKRLTKPSSKSQIIQEAGKDVKRRLILLKKPNVIPPSSGWSVAAPGSTGQGVTTLPYNSDILLNVTSNGGTYNDYVMDAGGGNSSILIGNHPNYRSGVTMKRHRLRNVAIGNSVSYGKHGIYADCINSLFEDFDIQCSSHASNGVSIRFGGCIFRRFTTYGAYFPIGIFDSDNSLSDMTVLVENFIGTFTNTETAIWCDAQTDWKSTFDLDVTFRNVEMIGPGAFLKIQPGVMRNGSFRLEGCKLNGSPVVSGDCPSVPNLTIV